MTQVINYCPTCGKSVQNQYIEGRDRRYCSQCEQPVYRNPKPCAGVLVVDGSQVLLVRRSEPPAVGAWSVPAGYLERDEPPKQCAIRELREETSVSVTTADLRFVNTAFVRHPDGTHVLVLVYATQREATSGRPTAGSDADAVQFWSLSELDRSDADIEPGYRSIISEAITICQDWPASRRS